MNADLLMPILQALHSTTPEIEAVAVISASGLVLCSVLPDHVDEDMVAAMGSALVSSGIRTADEFRLGDYGEMFLKGEQGYVIAVQTVEGASLLLMAEPDADIDAVLAAAHQVSGQIREQVNANMVKGSEMTTKKECAVTTRDLVVLLADLAEQIEVLIGKRGTISVFRYAGRQLGKRLGAGQQGDPEQARAIVADFFKAKEFMSGVTLDGKNAELHGCQIGLELHERGIDAGTHALCNFGFGLIDGVTESVTGNRIITLHVASEYHEAGVTCHETW